ncbi:MAG: hypothetical protein E7170_03070 [Firmicutes bacterium]|nr:hypothetical protein [Bacillota bacterium]
MKIINDDNKIIVFLSNNKILDLEIDEYEEYIKELINELEKEFSEEYDEICIYEDSNYGIILEFKNNDYFNYEIKINKFKTKNFLYKIDFNFIDEYIKENSKIYILNNDIYLKIDKKIDNKYFYKILEYSEIIYGERTLKIEKLSKEANYEKTSSSTSR